jgi:hypothetical protein
MENNTMVKLIAKRGFFKPNDVQFAKYFGILTLDVAE